MKRLWSAVLGLALSAATPAFADTNLVFAFWGDPPEVPPFEKIANDYMAKHPDVHIELQNAPWSGYFTKLDAQLAAGGGPDVFFITNVPSYAARNTLEDLGPWAWRHWRAPLDLPPGEHELVVRAWDSSAATQPEDEASLWNPKGYVNNARPRATIRT